MTWSLECREYGDYRERRNKRPARWKQNEVQSHIHGTKQGYAAQRKAKPNTLYPHTGRKTGLNHPSREPGKTSHRGPARSARCDVRERPTQGRVVVPAGGPFLRSLSVICTERIFDQSLQPSKQGSRLLGTRYILSIRTKQHASSTVRPHSAGLEVTLLDAASNPGGLSAGWRTKDGKAVEAGMKGFWYQACSVPSLPSLCASSLLCNLQIGKCNRVCKSETYVGPFFHDQCESTSLSTSSSSGCSTQTSLDLSRSLAYPIPSHHSLRLASGPLMASQCHRQSSPRSSSGQPC
jgi:hypothetical protein